MNLDTSCGAVYSGDLAGQKGIFCSAPLKKEGPGGFIHTHSIGIGFSKNFKYDFDLDCDYGEGPCSVMATIPAGHTVLQILLLIITGNTK